MCPSSEFSEKFVQAMKDRMAVSYAKYGPVKDAYPHKVSAIQSLDKRIEKYYETGNTEWLVDAANFLMIEFMFPSLPNAHFEGTDSKESPGRVSHEDGATNASNDQLSDEVWNEIQEARNNG